MKLNTLPGNEKKDTKHWSGLIFNECPTLLQKSCTFYFEIVSIIFFREMM